MDGCDGTEVWGVGMREASGEAACTGEGVVMVLRADRAPASPEVRAKSQRKRWHIFEESGLYARMRRIL